MPYSGPDPLRIPDEFWGRADVDAALESRSFADLFVLLRRWIGASQPRIATATGLTQARVSKIMNGQQSVEKFELVERIADGLQMPARSRQRLGLAPQQLATPSSAVALRADDAPSPSDDQSVPLEPMKRRSFLTGWTTVTAALATGVGAGAQPAGRVGVSGVERLRWETSRLYALDYQHGGDTLWHAARALVADAYEMLEHGAASPTVERLMLSAVGRTQMCAGWLAFDAGRLDVAQRCYNEALSLAHQNDDRDLAANALANLAFRSNLIGHPREAYRLAEAAARAAADADGHPHIATIPYLRLATSQSLTGDASGCDDAIHLARQALDRDGDMPAQAWYSFVGRHEIDGVEGTCALELGQPDRAEPLLTAAIDAHTDEYSRNRALYRVRLARARLDRGIADGAAEAANLALDDLAGHVASWRVQTELDTVARRLTPHSGIDGVDVFLRRHALAA